MIKPAIQAIFTCAAKAQGQVQDLRGDLEKLYATTNKAGRQALSLKLDADQPEKRNPDDSFSRSQLVACAQGMHARATAVRAKLEEAQRVATEFADLALHLKKSCGTDAKKPCELQAEIRSAVEAHKRLVQLLPKAREDYGSLRELSLYLGVASKGSNPVDLDEVRLARLLRDVPDAKSLFGEDSYGISSSTKGSTASLRLTALRDEDDGRRRFTAVVSTPLGEKKQVKLYDRADGLADTGQLTLGMEVWRTPRRLSNVLSLLSASISAGRDEREYLTDGAAPKEAKSRVHPLAATLTSAHFSFDKDNRNTHVLALSWQRTYEDSKTKVTRCPVSTAAVFVDCLQGPLGQPKRIHAGVLSYEYRMLLESVALAPKLSYNSRSKVADLDVPIYLVRGDEDKESKERPFTAGISPGWASKGKPEITERTSGVWRFGVFIGGPFSLLEFGK